MPTYLSLVEYRARTTIPGGIVDSCSTRGGNPQFWLEDWSSYINSRLAKRYQVDFKDPGPVPGIILIWLKRLVDLEVWQCVGSAPQGALEGWYERLQQEVKDEIKEAADSKDGMFELPLRDTDPLGASAVNKGAPLGYSEASPYVWTDCQREALRGRC